MAVLVGILSDNSVPVTKIALAGPGTCPATKKPLFPTPKG
ncbi:hypothetical protein Hsw_2430 [Hymenobacter swuensis DY53]|uniref:Uncharacterized protein n=1 Tax=Hymenobacter swuensis DY53 TaxID=1227739 RepID=W8F8I8_9BACT|nr:hypothetical protein Hsw_2430 [Hymenobacter swuensis DY53]